MQSTSFEPPADTTILRSGLNARACSRQHGDSFQTFVAWLRKQRIARESLPSGHPAVAEVMILKPVSPQAAGLRIMLPCGTALELTSRAVLPLALALLHTLM